MAMVLRLEVFRGGDGSKANGGKGFKKSQKSIKKGTLAQVEGITSG